MSKRFSLNDFSFRGFRTEPEEPLTLNKTVPYDWRTCLTFVFSSWLISRIVIIFFIQVIAPILPMQSPDIGKIIPLSGPEGPFFPQMGWELFTHWDGKWYEDIATRGYTYDANRLEDIYSIAFLPAYSILCNLVMRLGVPFKIAGPVINNVCFLLAAIVLYRWVEEIHHTKLAKWTTIALTCFPYSMFGSMAYTEGLFLLSTTASMRAFDRREYWQASLWGMVATTTRMFGLALAPTFVLTAWKQRRSWVAYAAGVGTLGGFVLYLIYCQIYHGDFLANFRAQEAWLGMQQTWPLLYQKLLARRFMSPDSILRVLMFWGSGIMFWVLRREFNTTALLYAFCSLGLLLYSNATDGIVRYVYGISSFSILLGYFLMRFPKIRIPLMISFTLMMTSIAARFTWWHFIA
jgi:Mannosyltransferase (PIG-V)